MMVLALLCVFFGIFYRVPLEKFIYPALGIEPGTAIFGTWESGLATLLIVVGVLLGLAVWFFGRLSKNVRVVPTWFCGEIQNSDDMIIPGTHFYKTVSSMGGLKGLYSGQEKGHFDPYKQSGRLGLTLTGYLKAMHSGILSTYLTWVVVGLLLVLFVICKIW